MTIQTDEQLANTKEKLRMLQERYELRRAEPADNAYVRELTLRSLKQLINQLTEEIVRYQSRVGASK